MRGTAGLLGFMLALLQLQPGLSKLPAITEDKTYFYWQKYGVVPGGYPAPTRVSGDVLVNFLYPVNDLRYLLQIPAILPYLPDFATNKDAKTASQLGPKIADNIPSGQNCKNLLSPGTVWYREYDVGYDHGQAIYDTQWFKDVPIKPASQSPIPLARIRDCCDPASCKEKIFEYEKQEAVIVVFNEGKEDLIFAGKCELCVVQEGLRTCHNGEYATDYTYFDQVGLPENHVCQTISN